MIAEIAEATVRLGDMESEVYDRGDRRGYSSTRRHGIGGHNHDGRRGVL
jgi:hypothetical protein